MLRSYCGFAGLIGGTALLGLGIGILNVSIPVWIRTTFQDSIGPVMGVYSTAMTALSALAAGVCVTLSARLSGWANAMAVFAVFPMIALPVWLFGSSLRNSMAAPASPVSFSAIAARYANWCVALFMGLQSALFFALIAWLPSMLTEHGLSAASGGLMVLLFQLVSLITNFLTPVAYQRFPEHRKRLAAFCAALYAAGFLMLLLPGSSEGGLVLGVVFMGLASGASLSFALTVIAVKGSNKEEAAALSAFSQCIGYLIAAPAPLLLGALFDAAGSFLLPVTLLLALCVPLWLFGRQAAGRVPGSG